MGRGRPLVGALSSLLLPASQGPESTIYRAGCQPPSPTEAGGGLGASRGVSARLHFGESGVPLAQSVCKGPQGEFMDQTFHQTHEVRVE